MSRNPPPPSSEQILIRLSPAACSSLLRPAVSEECGSAPHGISSRCSSCVPGGGRPHGLQRMLSLRPRHRASVSAGTVAQHHPRTGTRCSPQPTSPMRLVEQGAKLWDFS
ncbi:hypothetical protein AAFF_G00006770 [Aldrovandia affinis]|uniref:Uncharacterized protein n=1 Tax=Aldrovandia affinis TaxID=143900 RepID=A0AAD7TG67_9TELE|nr:hypothetical protein AAFF_G00006770 [Aldrovandia affinis]